MTVAQQAADFSSGRVTSAYLSNFPSVMLEMIFFEEVNNLFNT